MEFISVFFQYFGFFAMIGIIILAVLVGKELKKQNPTEEEKKELIDSGRVSAVCKNKKTWRTATLELRQQKALNEKLAEMMKDFQTNTFDDFVVKENKLDEE